MTLSLNGSDSTLMALDAEGREKRRYDFMLPRMVALIDRHGTVTYLETLNK